MLPEPSQRVSRLAPLHEVLARVAAIASPVTPRQVPVCQALGRVLGEDVNAAAPMPLRALALRDGWAVASDRVIDAGPYAPMPLAPAPAWVECGDPLPAGTDAVLAPDSVTMAEGRAEALATTSPGENVLPAGMDAGAGFPIRKAGERLRRTDLAALRTAGIDRVWTRVPRLRILRTHPAADNAKDFVGALIADAAQAEGSAVSSDWAPNARDLQHQLCDDACDAFITIGGTGMGRGDESVNALARIGHVEIHGMGIRPGDSAALGTVNSRPVLLLPGRLDSALAGWLLVGQPFHARLTGLAQGGPGVGVKLARKIVSAIGLAEMVPVGFCAGGVEPLASGCFPAQSLTRAAGWVFVPPESEGFPQGATVELQPFP